MNAGVQWLACGECVVPPNAPRIKYERPRERDDDDDDDDECSPL